VSAGKELKHLSAGELAAEPDLTTLVDTVNLKPARDLALSMDGPRLARARFSGETINRLQLSIGPLVQRALLASMRSADRRPITLAGICGPIEPTGLADPGPTGCHNNFVRPRTAETEA
jgi:hypothetical protein